MTNKEFLINQWTSEIKSTVTAFRTIPDAKADYKPNPKNRTAQELVAHMLGEINDMINMVTIGSIEHTPATFKNMEEAANAYETKCNEFLTKLASVDEETWSKKIIPFLINGNKAFEAPMTNMAWNFFKDTIHHRGQLSTYFRPMGVKNPSIYGPTAEMMEEMMAGSN